MFENLPQRSEMLDTDYLVSYREGALLADSVTPWPVLKDTLLSGLMIKNKYYKISQRVDISTSKTIISIKGLNNDLIAFEDISHSFMGIFQIYCNKHAPSYLKNTLKNIMCLYDLKWIPKNLDAFSLVGGPKVLPINYYAGGSGIDIADEIDLPKSYQHIFIPPFNPQTTTGHFSLEIQFTSSLSNVDINADINADIWITETR
jgi:hypothetical protein